MLPQNDGVWLRGETLSFALSSKLKFKTDFLSKARAFDAPEIAEFVFQFNGSVGGVTATALGIDAAKLFSRIVIRDKENRCDVSGAMLFAINEAEFGVINRADLPATVASGSTNTTYDYRLSVPYEFKQGSLRESDYRIPVPYILEGGTIQANLAAAVPTGYAAVQSDWSVTVWCRVVENRVRELKSNLIWEQYEHTRKEDYFPVHASLRDVIAATDLTTTDYTSLATYTIINSRALDFESDMDPRFFKHRYARQRILDDAFASNNIFGASKAWPIVVPDVGQKIGSMPIVDQLDLRLGAAPVANAAIAIGKINQRNPTLAAMWMGYNSPAELAAAVEKYGYVVDEHGTPAVEYDPELVTKLPIRLKPNRD